MRVYSASCMEIGEIVLCTSIEQQRELLKSLGKEIYRAEKDTGFIECGADVTCYREQANPCFMVRLAKESREKDKAVVYALLAHEAVHIMQAVRRKFSPNNLSNFGAEAEAYCVQKVTQILILELDSQMKEEAACLTSGK